MYSGTLTQRMRGSMVARGNWSSVLKTVVTRVANSQVVNGGANSDPYAAVYRNHEIAAIIGRGSVGSASGGKMGMDGQGQMKSPLLEAMSLAKTQIEYLVDGEPRVWTCKCGHEFKDTEDWHAGSDTGAHSAECEAPKCPGPNFYIAGPGKQLVADGTAAVTEGPVLVKLDNSSMGGRFK